MNLALRGEPAKPVDFTLRDARCSLSRGRGSGCTAIELSELRQDRSADFSPLPAVLAGPERGGLKSALLNSMAVRCGGPAGWPQIPAVVAANAGSIRPRTCLASACGCSGSDLGCRRGRHLAARNGYSERGIDVEAHTRIRRAGCPALRQAGRPPLR